MTSRAGSGWPKSRSAAPGAAWRALLPAALALLLSCVPAPALPPPPPGQAPELSAAERESRHAAALALFAQLREAHAAPRTVSGDAKAFVDAAENGGRYALLFAVERPGSLRIDALMPWGEPAASLVASAGRLAFRDERSKKFYRGASTPKNLSLLLPAPLADTELIALLCGALPELPGGEPTEIEDAGEGRRRLIIRTLPPGTTRLRGLTETAVVAPDLSLIEVARFIEGGPKAQLLWSASLEEQGGAGVASLPGLIQLRIDKDSVGQSRDVTIDLRLKNLSADHAPPASAFTLLPPAGMPIIELDQAR